MTKWSWIYLKCLFCSTQLWIFEANSDHLTFITKIIPAWHSLNGRYFKLKSETNILFSGSTSPLTRQLSSQQDDSYNLRQEAHAPARRRFPSSAAIKQCIVTEKQKTTNPACLCYSQVFRRLCNAPVIWESNRRFSGELGDVVVLHVRSPSVPHDHLFLDTENALNVLSRFYIACLLWLSHPNLKY